MSETPISIFASYVPNLIARNLAIDPHPITSPTSEKFRAAVLFADISGFTALADRLTQHFLFLFALSVISAVNRLLQ